MSAHTAESLLTTINKSLTSTFGPETYYNFDFPPNTTEESKIQTLLALSATNLQVVMIIEHDGDKYISSIPPLANSDITFYKAHTEYDSPSGRALMWDTSNNTFPRIKGSKTSLGTFDVNMSPVHWVIQENETEYSAVHFQQGETYSPFNVPYTNWKRHVGQDVLLDSNNTPLLSLSGEYISSSTSYNYDIPFEENINYVDLVNTRHKQKMTFKFKPNQKHILENTEQEQMKVYYGVRLHTSNRTTTPTSIAIIVDAPVTTGSFFNIDNYIEVSKTINSTTIIKDYSIKYGSSRESGKSRVRRLRLLGYI